LRYLFKAVRALPVRPPSPELALYLVAGAVYVAVGVAVPELLFSWVEGAAFLLIAVWVLPALVGRFR
jgi:hypothetical protein